MEKKLNWLLGRMFLVVGERDDENMMSNSPEIANLSHDSDRPDLGMHPRIQYSSPVAIRL